MDNKIVFMGSPAFAVPTLRLLLEKYWVIGVVTQPDKPAGRGKYLKQSAIKKLSLLNHLEIIQPYRTRDEKYIEKLAKWNPDVIVVAAFGQILPQSILDLPSNGCINVHASILPRWRGAAPIQAAILSGDEETGVTIMKMDSGIDTGPILSQQAVKIFSDDTSESLSNRLAKLGASLLVKTLRGYLKGEIKPRPQRDNYATYAKMVKKKDGLLDFKKTAQELERKVRAYKPWPGAFTYWGMKLLKIHGAHVIFCEKLKPGQRGVIEKMPAIGTKDGAIILDEVQLEGRRSMAGTEFLRGARNWG